jgi:hypothetical protein
MKVRTVATIVTLLAVAPPTFACEDGLSIQEVSSGGSIIVLDDGSVWEMTAGDASGWHCQLNGRGRLFPPRFARERAAR